MKNLLVRRIIPQSVVDGPGNRVAVFLQGCNIRCEYCHNPETQAMCDDEARLMTAEEVMAEVRKGIPFIRGITVSGGECMLQAEAMTELFRLAKKEGLTCLIDSNGSIDFSRYPQLMEYADGVMLDMKAWNKDVYRKLTGGSNEMVKRNLVWLADREKLEEVRVVCLKDVVDVEDDLRGIAQLLGEHLATTRLKLIRFRKNGVIGRLADSPSPTDMQMEQWETLARELGFEHIERTL